MDRDIEFQRLACDMLGLIHPEDRADYDGILLELGTFRIIDSEAVTEKIVALYLQYLRDMVEEFQQGIARRVKASAPVYDQMGRLSSVQHQFLEETKKHAVLTPRDFRQFNGKADTEERRDGYGQGRAYVKTAARHELARLQRFTSFSSDFHGYCDYLDRACPALFFRLSQDIPALVPESNHTEHAYIMSTTKTGKSELLKAQVLQYVQTPDYASVLVLDPGGDMTRQIASWPELDQERLIYIDPAMSEDHVPVINPFDVKGLSRREKGKLAGQIVAVIGSLVDGKMGGDISTAMEAVLYPSVRLLIDLPGTSLADLPKIMIDDPWFIAQGAQSKDKRVASFFRDHFDNVNELTKKSITQKVNSILDKGELAAVLCGRNSIDLKHALNNRKIVLVNLAKGALDFEESRVIGMMLVAMAQSIGMERVHTPEPQRPQTHLIIDECQNFITAELKSIIRETRKFGLSVTLAQQELGGDMPLALKNVVIKTTSTKIAGRSDITETRQTGDIVGVSAEEIRRCDAGQFFYRAGNKPAFKLRVRSDRLKNKGGVSWTMWERIKDQQLARYYRSINDADASQQRPKEENTSSPAPGPGKTFDWDSA